ncbi:hypothetical protein V8C34DRAFT_264637 [Trichoderma compactum]
MHFNLWAHKQTTGRRTQHDASAGQMGFGRLKMGRVVYLRSFFFIYIFFFFISSLSLFLSFSLPLNVFLRTRCRLLILFFVLFMYCSHRLARYHGL